MKSRSSREIRAEFLRFFEQKQHQVCPSYPLVPPNDPTLLFTNAGMVQFKDVFTGKEKRDFVRAASSQKCVRAGGKHNDLENVGFTARHHTFFEMLGNFSFGDYFKKEAIRFGWEFLVDEMKLPVDRLWVTVFEGDPKEDLPADEEAAELWQSEVGVDPDRILRFGKKDNFWSMGETGPCGPCSEVHYDQGEAVSCHEPGGCQGIACECDRYLEVWNLVFMQFERDNSGKLSPLPAPSIDTGMGLERLCALVQGVTNNYDTDLFLPLIHRMGNIAGLRYGTDPDVDISLRVIADHARATTFLMADGVLPSNEGRGYVLRRIMRRAIRHGNKLGVKDPFLHDVCLEVVRQMGETYQELPERHDLLIKATRLEEETFRRTLESGLKILKREIAERKSRGEKQLPGELVFDLQARDGFPPDLTAVIAGEHDMSIDQDAYKKAFAHHQEVSGGSLGIEGVDDIFQALHAETGETEFAGHQDMQGKGVVQALLAFEEQTDEKGRARVMSRSRISEAAAGQLVEAVVSPTPFYGETGGQVGDTGTMTGPDGKGNVVDAQRPIPALIVQRLKVEEGTISVGDEVEQVVDWERRGAIKRNHSATHLLQAALRRVLGSHVNQSGSLVAPDRFRFDFSHFAPMKDGEIAEVEREVNRMIRENYKVDVSVTDMDGARKAGATMLFGEKYDDEVRMVRMGESLELCGGTHAERTGDIGVFKILSEGSIKAGVRRIEAVTGSVAFQHFQEVSDQMAKASDLLKSESSHLLERIQAIKKHEGELAREVDILKQRLATSGTHSDPAQEARTIKGTQVLAVRAVGIQLAGLREFADNLRDRLGGGVILAFTEDRGKLSAVCTVPKELTGKIRAGDLLKAIFQVTGGKGGGRPDFAQGGGGNPELLEEGIEAFYPLVEKSLSS